MTEKLQPATGCWIDGHWGQYGIKRLIEIAREYGWDQWNAAELDYESEHIFDIADEAERWLNKNVAREGFAFGWVDSEFFYMNTEWFEQA